MLVRDFNEARIRRREGLAYSERPSEQTWPQHRNCEVVATWRFSETQSPFLLPFFHSAFSWFCLFQMVIRRADVQNGFHAKNIPPPPRRQLTVDLDKATVFRFVFVAGFVEAQAHYRWVLFVMFSL